MPTTELEQELCEAVKELEFLKQGLRANAERLEESVKEAIHFYSYFEIDKLGPEPLTTQGKLRKLKQFVCRYI